VQFKLFARLVNAGVDVRAERELPATSPRSKSGRFYADLAVFRDGKIVALCECKSRGRPLKGKRQKQNYEECGYPFIVAGADNIEEAFGWLRDHGQGFRHRGLKLG